MNILLKIGLMLLSPSHGILGYIVVDFLVVLLVANYVVIKRALPNVFAIFFIAKPFKGAHKLRNGRIFGTWLFVGFRRDRPPGLSVIKPLI
jgi:hypothetical protein